MKSILTWMLFVGVALWLFGGTTVDAWNRQFFNRYSRNLFQNGNLDATGNVDLGEFNAYFGGGDAGGRNGIERSEERGGYGQQEVYGIVEPLIEDLPCVDRPCGANADCCPSGVCLLSFGVGKCNYDAGRKRDLCRQHTDCEPGLSCLRGVAGNLYCQPPTALLAAKSFAAKEFGDDCSTSSDCNINKFMCCQLQRTHPRVLAKKRCAFFRDPFMCIDISPTEDENIRAEPRLPNYFNQRLM